MIAEPFGQNGTFCSFGFLHQKSSSNDVSMDPNLLLSMSNIPKTSKIDYCYQQNEKQYVYVGEIIRPKPTIPFRFNIVQQHKSSIVHQQNAYYKAKAHDTTCKK